MLELQKLRTAHDAKDLAVSFVECIGQETAVQQLVDSHRLSYPILRGGEAAAKAYKIDAYSNAVIVDRAGRIFAVASPYDAVKFADAVAKAMRQ